MTIINSFSIYGEAMPARINKYLPIRAYIHNLLGLRRYEEKMRGLRIIAFSIATLSFTACTTMPSSILSGPRSIILGGKTYSETDEGKFVSWRCKDFVYNSGTLVEVGIFTDSKLSGLGFVLYDGGNSGELTNYQRKGINHRWDWGPNGADFAFIIKPDGTGLFYDFSSVPVGTSTKANDVYKCYQ